MKDNTPERLAARIAQSEHNLAEAEKQKLREAAGCAEWAAKHSRNTTLRVDRSSPRTKTVSEYPVV